MKVHFNELYSAMVVYRWVQFFLSLVIWVVVCKLCRAVVKALLGVVAVVAIPLWDVWPFWSNSFDTITDWHTQRWKTSQVCIVYLPNNWCSTEHSEHRVTECLKTWQCWGIVREKSGQEMFAWNTHTFNGICPELPGWAGTRKVNPIWILLNQDTVSGSGISWAICKSASRSRQITMPAPHHSVFYSPDALHAAWPTVSKHWRQRRPLPAMFAAWNLMLRMFFTFFSFVEIVTALKL